MSTIKTPVGPQPSKVYRRRRLVVGLGLLALLVIAFLIIVRPGSSSGEPRGSAPSGSSSAATATPGATSVLKADKAVAADGAPCDPARVQVEAITDAVEYEPGRSPRLSVSITNTGENACVINAGTSTQVFTITSGEDVYWASTDCQTDAADANVTLKPGIPVSSAESITWDRSRSAKDTCGDETRDVAPAAGASYHLSVSVDGIESANPKQFLLY